MYANTPFLCSYQDLVSLQVLLQAPNIVTQYNHDHACWEFVNCIDEELTSQLKLQLQQCSAVGVVVDESTDISTTAQVVMLVKFLRKGQLLTRILGLRQLQDKSANSITEVLLATLAEYGVGMEKVYGFCSDGASVMVGSVSGVATQLKSKAPRLLSFHCVAHRVPLASEGLHSIDAIASVEELLGNIVNYFNRSTKRYTHLHWWCSELQEDQIRLQRLYEVRWLSEATSLQCLLRMLGSLLSCFQEEKATGNEQVCHLTCLTVAFYYTHFHIGYCRLN